MGQVEEHGAIFPPQPTRARLKTLPQEKTPAAAPSPLAVVMFDGCQLRHRGAGWGKEKTPEPRVEWHEHKLGVFYRHEQNAAGQLTQKVVVNWQGSPVELGERLHWEARRGRSMNYWKLGRARLAHWEWRGGIGLRPKTKTLQAPRPVLD